VLVKPPRGLYVMVRSRCEIPIVRSGEDGHMTSGSEAPADPPVRGVGGVVHDDRGRLLVVRRGHPPYAGHWSIPGGRVLLGEDDATAVVRELAEETGLAVRAGELLGVVELGTPGAPIVVHDYRCELLGGTLAAGDDAAAAAWVTAAQLRALPTTPRLLPLLTEWGVLPA
jgi:ADP-ribose pyrophosphatase YjhB (NUDIX family)